METVHPNTSRSRILIADDHAIFTEALRLYLEKTFTEISSIALSSSSPPEQRARESPAMRQPLEVSKIDRSL